MKVRAVFNRALRDRGRSAADTAPGGRKVFPVPNFVSEHPLPGPLKNARHERFVQERAKGRTVDAAFIEAGFSANRGNAARLNANESVQTRLAELQAGSAKKTELTVANVTRRLLRIAAKGERFREPPGLSVARAALMDAAKLNGLAPERHEFTGKNGGPIEYRNLGEPEIDERLNTLQEKHERPVVH